jgi:hypothetical protein
MIRTQVQLTEQQARTLKELAHRENKSVAELTRQAIEYWLQTVVAVSMEERRRRALAAVGRFHSGVSDVSEQHDDHLAEAYGQWSSS